MQILSTPRPTPPPSSASPVPTAAEPLPAAPQVQRLVLFVGAGLRPDSTLAGVLAQDGVRPIWRDSTGEAVRTAGLASFDAVCVDITTLGPAAGDVIDRLRQALPCPLLVIGAGLDAREEIDVLERGADLYLARPVPARRLCAHLMALLRRAARSSAAAGGEFDATVSLRGRDHPQGVEVTIRGLRLR